MIDLGNAGIEDIADFVELLAAAVVPKPLSLPEARQLSASHAQIAELKISQAFSVLKKRAHLLGDQYPFKVDDNYIVATNVLEGNLYFNYLMLSAPSPIRQMPAWNLTSAAKILEHIVEMSFHDYFGRGTQTINFGFPSEVNRPSDFNKAVEWLASKTGIPVGSGYRDARFKDGGVDIFVWKSFPDMKPGVPIMLLQCTLQEKFLSKIRDVDTRLWSSWLSSDIDPVAGLCVPHVVSKIEDWNEITTRGLLFDRMRLSLMANNIDFKLTAVDQAFVNQLLQQFKAQIS